MDPTDKRIAKDLDSVIRLLHKIKRIIQSQQEKPKP